MTLDTTLALRKWIFPLLTLALVAVVARVKELSLRTQLGMVAPDHADAALVLVLWIAWIAAAEPLSAKLGVARAERWAAASRTALAVMLVGMVVLAPIAEELMFRGLMYARICESAGWPSAIAATAALFAAIHLRYGPIACAFILVDGVMLGLARHATGSVLVPIAMHMTGNLLAFYQRLPARG